jgi:hypothetical protein
MTYSTSQSRWVSRCTQFPESRLFVFNVAHKTQTKFLLKFVRDIRDLPHFRCRVKLRLKHPKAALALSEARNLPAHTSAA